MTARRNFLKSAAGLGLSAPLGAFAVTSPYERVGSRIRIGLAAYSFRKHFRFKKGEANDEFLKDAKEIDMAGFIEYCAEKGCDGAELTSYFFRPDLTDRDFAEYRRIAHVNGIAIAGTAVGNNFSHPKSSTKRAEEMAYVKSWIDRAGVMGAPHVRVFAGVHPDGVSEEEAEKNAIEALEEAGDYAAERGILLGIENHDSISTADRLLRIVTAVDNPFVGVNLDTGNFRTEDPYRDMEASAPYALNVQLKTHVKVGEEEQPVDLDRVVGILRDSGYAGYLVVEYEDSDAPFEGVPRLLEELRALI